MLTIGVIAVLSAAPHHLRTPEPCASASASAIRTGRDSASVLRIEQAWISPMEAAEETAERL